MNENLTKRIHPVDEMLPAGRLFAYGLQHVLAMYAGAVAVPIIIAQTLHLSPAELVHLISPPDQPEPTTARSQAAWALCQVTRGFGRPRNIASLLAEPATYHF